MTRRADRHDEDRRLAAAVGLANTWDEYLAVERVVDASALQRFLDAFGLEYGGAPTARDLRTVRQLRARLRDAFRGTADERHAALNDLLRRTVGVPRLVPDADGSRLVLEPRSRAVSVQLVADCAAALAQIVTERGVERLKVCAAESCEDVFVDLSPNGSRRYCDPAVCGNRTNVGAYRMRQRRLALRRESGG